MSTAAKPVFEVAPPTQAHRRRGTPEYERNREVAIEVAKTGEWVAIWECGGKTGYETAHSRASKIRNGRVAAFRHIGPFISKVEPHGTAWRVLVKFVGKKKPSLKETV